MAKTMKTLTPYMIRKKKQRQAEYARKYYAKNRDKIRAQQDKSRKRKRLDTTELIIPDTTQPITTDTDNLTTVQSISVTKERVEVVTNSITFVVDKSMRLTISTN
tara:strand:- start:18 stop:332 length:315 start_codon:yes stop_codon:yes gene_type:complete